MNTEEQVKRVRAWIDRLYATEGMLDLHNGKIRLSDRGWANFLSNSHIGIIDDDQSLPEISNGWFQNEQWWNYKAQQSVVNANFEKLIKVKE